MRKKAPLCPHQLVEYYAFFSAVYFSMIRFRIDKNIAMALVESVAKTEIITVLGIFGASFSTCVVVAL